MSVPSFTAKKFLRVYVCMIPSGAIRGIVRFNNDTGSNYAYRVSINGAADGTAVSTAALIPGAAETSMQLLTMDIINVAAQEKLVYHEFVSFGTAGAGFAPTRIEGGGKWANTANQITRLDVINDQAGDFAAGSELIILGHN